MPITGLLTRPARLKRRRQKVYPKRRCKYCNRLFDLTKAHKKFCSFRCQRAFNKQGMALGPLKDKLPGWMRKEVTLQLAVIAELVAGRDPQEISLKMIGDRRNLKYLVEVSAKFREAFLTAIRSEVAAHLDSRADIEWNRTAS